MSHLPFTLLAYFFNALAVLANKFLLNKAIPDPLIYVFYISLISFLAVLGIPFTRIPTLEVFAIASASTILWTLGAYFMFKALKIGQVSRVIPVIGTLIPLALLGVASETHTISGTQIWAVLILTGGMILLTLTDWQGRLSGREIIFEILSAAGFAASYLILRQAYLHLDFFSVLVWSRLILLPFALIVLTIPTLRRKIIASSLSLLSRRNRGSINTEGLVFIGGQIGGAISEFLLLFSISLANPALVNSLQGTQYVFIFIFVIILAEKYPGIFGEKYTLLNLILKFMGIILIGIGLCLLTLSSN